MSSLAAIQPYASAQSGTQADIFKPSLLLLLAHIPLGIAIKLVPALGWLHTAVVVCLGLIWTGQRNTERVTYLCAYVVSAEVLWRMTDSAVFWELAKYLLILLMGLTVFLRGLRGIALAPIAAVLFLTPSMFLTASNMAAEQARQAIVFNILCYVVLMICASFFHPLEISREELKRILFALILPAVSIASIALYGTRTAEKLQFVNDSNFQLSGGFGPNQVSSLLGLAMFACFAYYLLESDNKLQRRLVGLLAIWFGFQTMMTFSRGGLYCGIAASLCLLRGITDRRVKIRLFASLLAAAALSVFVIFPMLNDFTEGKLAQRFEDTQTTHRTELFNDELDLWRDNIVFGVGIGEAKFKRTEMRGNASHSEFSRLLAEHGTVGIVSLLLLTLSVVTNVIKSQSPEERSLKLACGVWVALFTFTAALRLAAPAFLLAMTFAHFDLAGTNADA